VPDINEARKNLSARQAPRKQLTGPNVPPMEAPKVRQQNSRHGPGPCSPGVQKRQLQPKPPARGARLGRFGPVPHPRADLQRRVAHLEQLTDGEVDRDGPLSALPVVGRLGIDGDRRLGTRDVGQERLDEGRADVRPIVVAPKGLDVVDQAPTSPGGRLLQRHRRRPRSPFVTAERVRGQCPRHN
jgi:hypothetical protein